MNEPTHLDLFSGIGGFSLAFEAEGFRTIGFSEIDPYACAVLKKHWPTVPRSRTMDLSSQFPLFDAMSLPEDSLASLTALPGSDKARKMTVRSGRRCAQLLTGADPLTCLVRTWLESSVWNSTLCYLTWKESATPQGRLLFRLVPLTLTISAPESGFWPTPMSYGHGENSNRPGITKLDCAVRPELHKHLWPTPRSSANENRQTKPKPSQMAGKHGLNLSTAVHMWPMPRAADAKMVKGGKRGPLLNPSLGTAAKNSINIASGSLNPNWVEWLMGYPIGHTVLEPSEMPSSRRSRKSSRGKSTTTSPNDPTDKPTGQRGE